MAQLLQEEFGAFARNMYWRSTSGMLGNEVAF